MSSEGRGGVLSGKVAVITGGSSGIGLATAKRFVEEGAFVFIMGRRQTELNKALADIGANAIAVQGDVAKLEDLDRLYMEVSRKGRVDILFANAAIIQPQPLGQIISDSFDQQFATM